MSNVEGSDPYYPQQINLPLIGKISLTRIVFAAILLIYGLSFIPRTLWAENEAYYAMGAQNVLDGHVLMPVIYDNVLADKPPLMFWWVALVSLPFGEVSAFTARLANVIPAFATLLVLFMFARGISSRVACYAVALLATAHEFYEVAFEVNTDIMLTALLFASWMSIYNIMTHGFTWRRWAMLWIPMSLGMLVKGPVAPALSCLVAIAYALPHYGPREGWRRLLSLRPFAGGLLCFAPFILWCALVYASHGSGPLRVVLLQHNLQRFVDAFDHEKPWYYFFYTILIIMLPWSFIFPVLGLQLWRDKTRGIRLPEWQSFALTVVAVVFVFFSISSSKRGYYLLPLMPWLSLLLAYALSRIGQHREATGARRSQRLVMASIALTLFAVMIHVSVGYAIIDRNRTITPLVDEVHRTTSATDKLILFHEEDPRIMYYLRDNMTFYKDKPESSSKMIEVLKTGREVDILSMKKQLRRLQELSPVPLYIEGTALYRKNPFYILTTNPTPETPPLSSVIKQKTDA